MSALKKYLEKHHQNPDKITDDFSKSFGVNIRKEGDLFLFKYGIISSNWGNPITHECRGSILKFSDNGWGYMSRPFDKFFNQHEGHCPIFKPEAFEEVLPASALTEKADGTCIQLWHSGEQWRISTLGTITTQNVYDNNLTFEELFLKTAGRIFYRELDTNITYIFELCSDENRIVTQYKEDHVVLLGARDRSGGQYLQDVELDHEIYYGAFREANIRRPCLIYPWDLGLRSLSDVKEFVEKESKTEKYGKYPEGFVLYCWNSFRPLAKLKNLQYKSLHSFGGGDIAHSKNQIIATVFAGTIDDVYDALSERLKDFADDIKQKAAAMTKNAMENAEKIKELDFPTRKAYAAFVQDNIEKKAHSFFFKNANVFMKKEIDDIETKFEFWLKENYKKFEWKN